MSATFQSGKISIVHCHHPQLEKYLKILYWVSELNENKINDKKYKVTNKNTTCAKVTSHLIARLLLN